MIAARNADKLRELKDKASALTLKGKLAGALEALQQALALAPHDIALHQKRAEVLVKLGRNGEAIRAYQHVIGGWADEGHFLRAIAICKVILQLDASHRETQKALADLYARQRGGKPASVPEALGSELGAKRPDSTELVIDVALPEAVTDGPEEDVVLEVDEADLVVELEKPELPKVPLFSDLTPNAFQAVLDGLEIAAHAPGEAIVREGDKDQSMFAVAQGTVRVVREDEGGRSEVAQMEEGAFFGELALVHGAPRLATVEAATDVVLVVFTKDRMRAICREHPSVEKVLEKFCRERLLANVLRASPIFEPLTDAEREAVADAFKPRSYERNDVILRAGLPSDALHVILRGRCRVSSPEGGDFPDLREGDLFGEISLVTGKPATATVKAATACTVLRLSTQAFKTHVLGNAKVADAVRRLGSERAARKPLVAR